MEKKHQQNALCIEKALRTCPNVVDLIIKKTKNKNTKHIININETLGLIMNNTNNDNDSDNDYDSDDDYESKDGNDNRDTDKYKYKLHKINKVFNDPHTCTCLKKNICYETQCTCFTGTDHIKLLIKSNCCSGESHILHAIHVMIICFMILLN